MNTLFKKMGKAGMLLVASAAVLAGTKTVANADVNATSIFGPNVYVFDTSDSTESIQKKVDEIYSKQEKNQFGTERYAVLFKPGTYSQDLHVETGFYTEVSGLGISPEDTVIGNVNSKAEWMTSRKPNGDINYNATCNFWRSVENLTLDISTSTSREKQSVWAVSQGTSFRRMNVKGNLAIQEYGGYASGGFLADSKISNTITAWSQQQWLTRNSSCNFWDGGVWNINFVGMSNGVPNGQWPDAPFTKTEKTEEIQEKPFVVYDENKGYGVYVPEIRKDCIGTSWENGVKGKFIPIDEFYIANPQDSAATINAQLNQGKNLILTPGIYNISEPINVTKENTIVLGLGYATLKQTGTNQCLTVGDVGGVIVADVMFDAGTQNGKSLMTVGSNKSVSHKDNPITLANLYFRVGGADTTACKVETCLTINSSDVICDNFWVWRADHGKEVGWDKNTSKTGVIVNGDNVTAYALMVEHFQEYQTIWNGENGKTFMYQCELPYDVPNQEAWMNGDVQGYAGYYVAPQVNEHHAYGMGVYANFTKSCSYLNHAIIVPDKPGVSIANACSVVLSGKGGIDNVVNNAGAYALFSGDISRVMSYCNGNAVAEPRLQKFITMTTVNGVPKKKVYTGKNITFNNIEITYRDVTLREGIDYTITYKNNKKIGKATVKINGIGIYKGTQNVTFNIVPAKANIKAKGLKNKISVKLSKVKGTSGFEIVYSLKKNFKKKHVVTCKKNKYTIKKLAGKKTYYVKARAFKKNNKKKIYGSFSKTIKVKVKA
ncbi:glycosyl hydrolase family 28-related protein [Eubacterium sp.]